MRRQALLPISFCAALLFASAAARAADDDAEKAAETFESLFGNDVKNARATPDARDDADLAARLLDTARKTQGQPAFAAILCEKAYELGCANPGGYATAAAALELLAQTAPDRAAGCAERLLEVRQRQFDAARGDEKKAAGEALLACLLPAADAKEKAGAAPDAAAICRRAQAVAAAIDSPRRAEVDARADTLAMKMRVARQIADVKAMLARDPKNVGAQEGLVRLCLVDLDDPAEAALNLAGVADEKLLKYVPAAAKGIEAAPEVACMELADWYRGMAETAPPAAKAAMYARAKAYLARFLEIHPAQDLDRTRATLALAKIDEAAAKLAAPARPTPKPPLPREKPAPAIQQWIDLLAVVKPDTDAVQGKWELSAKGLAAKAGDEACRISLPVLALGDYELEVSFVRQSGQGVQAILPVGATTVRLVLGGWENGISGLHKVDGKPANSNPTTVSPGGLENGHMYALSVRVACKAGQAQVNVVLDGKPYISWTGAESALSDSGVWALPNSRCIGLGAQGCHVTFTRARIRMLSGEAKPLRP